MSLIKFPTKRIFSYFYILKINRMMSFCNLFMERPHMYRDRIVHSDDNVKLLAA